LVVKRRKETFKKGTPSLIKLIEGFIFLHSSFPWKGGLLPQINRGRRRAKISVDLFYTNQKTKFQWIWKKPKFISRVAGVTFYGFYLFPF